MSETIYTKEYENTLTVIEIEPAKVIPEKVLPARKYEYGFLLSQRDSIQNQWDEQLAQKAKEIEEINLVRGEEKAFVEKLILEADKLGIIVKQEVVVEEVVAEVVVEEVVALL